MITHPTEKLYYIVIEARHEQLLFHLCGCVSYYYSMVECEMVTGCYTKSLPEPPFSVATYADYHVCSGYIEHDHVCTRRNSENIANFACFICKIWYSKVAAQTKDVVIRATRFVTFTSDIDWECNL